LKTAAMDQTEKGGSQTLNFFRSEKNVKSDYGVV